MPFSRTAQVLPAWGCRGVRGWHQLSMNMDFWKFSGSWEKVSKVQTKRSAGVKCGRNPEIKFPSQKEASAAGWPRGRGE